MIVSKLFKLSKTTLPVLRPLTILVFVAFFGLLTSCVPEQGYPRELPQEVDSISEVEVQLGAYSEYITYYYDEAHEVCIWVYRGFGKGGITVLPASEVKNPESPMEFAK